MFGRQQPSSCTQTCCTHPEYTVLNLQPENFGLRTTTSTSTTSASGGGQQIYQNRRRNSVQQQQLQQPQLPPRQQNQKHKRQQSEGGGGVVEYRNMAEEPNKYLRAVVDIGSNGIRFSITDIHPRTARIIPTLFSDRASISLYNSQFKGTTKSPISPEVISSIVVALKRFQHVCEDFRVPPTCVRVVATEATREAQNSQEFRNAITSATGWNVEMLSKEDEGRIGALGIASSFTEVRGLVMDLGGGSTQLSWMISGGAEGKLRMAERAVSLPFGAAALTKKLSTALDRRAVESVRAQIRDGVRGALDAINVPEELRRDAERDGGYTMYLSGGGFRGFGYLLLAEHEVQPYPIPIINGFTTSGASVLAHARHLQASSTDPTVDFMTEETIPQHLLEKLESTFRISGNRATQVPAVSFLISAIMSSLPTIKTVVFCQGGVREGCLFETLPPEIRAQQPLTVATAPFAPPSAGNLLQLIQNGLPRSAPDVIYSIIAPALANVLCHHSGVPKESRTSAGLHFTTNGQLSSAHGLSHPVRILLALSLCERWGGDVHEMSLRDRMEKLVEGELAWWARYLGAVAGAVGAVYPAGVVRAGRDGERVRLFAQDEVRKGNTAVVLRVHARADDPCVHAAPVLKAFDRVEKVGKKKRCAALGYRRKVVVKIMEDL